jgi:AraC family transcriptional regulator
MNWYKQLEDSLDYIEANLTGDIDVQELGRLTHCSAYHYQRIFSFIVGTTLAEYIRRRKMTLAGADLQSGSKVIDVAIKYGYDAPNSFARAFRRVHGIAPSKAASTGIVLKSYPRVRLKINITGDSKMEYRIEEKAAFRVVGIGHDLSKNVEESFSEIPRFWESVGRDGTLEELFGLANQEPAGLMGITIAYDTTQGASQGTSRDATNKTGNGLGNYAGCNPRYLCAVASDMNVPEGFEEFEIPALTWAVFEGSGEISESSNAVQELATRVLVDWLPSSGFKLTSGPDIEIFQSDDPADLQFEVWIPVTKD